MADEQMMSRRQSLGLAAGLGLGWLAGLTGQGWAEAAKKNKRRKRNKGKRRKKRGKNGKKKKSTGGRGRKVVRVAKKYKGNRYKMGGASPKGFDCSGFTWFVFDKAVGKEIGRTVKDQYRHGKKVKKQKWKAGDIVFFKNTYERGLSHCGIYMGGGDFIHAENERTGVVISNLKSGYYKEHYAGARRIV